MQRRAYIRCVRFRHLFQFFFQLAAPSQVVIYLRKRFDKSEFIADAAAQFPTSPVLFKCLSGVSGKFVNFSKFGTDVGRFWSKPNRLLETVNSRLVISRLLRDQCEHLMPFGVARAVGNCLLRCVRSGSKIHDFKIGTRDVCIVFACICAINFNQVGVDSVGIVTPPLQSVDFGDPTVNNNVIGFESFSLS